MKTIKFAVLAIVAILLSFATPVAAQYRLDCTGRDAYRCATNNLRNDVTQHTRELAYNIRSGRYNDYHRYDRYDDYNRRSGLGLTFRFGGGSKAEKPGDCIKKAVKAMQDAGTQPDQALIVAGCTGNRLPAPPTQTANTQQQAAAPASTQQPSRKDLSSVFLTDSEFCNNSQNTITVYVRKTLVGTLSAGQRVSLATLGARPQDVQYCLDGQACQIN